MRISLVIVFSLLQLTVFAQKASTWIESGDEAMENGEFYTATQRYHEAWLLDSTSFDLTVKYAEALRLSKQYQEAERLYDKAYHKDRGRIFEKGLFYLASMQKLNGEYRESLRNFKRYHRQIRREEDTYEFKKTEQEIESLLYAMNARVDSGEVEIKHISRPVNTENAEFSPFPGPDSTLFFSRLVTGNIDSESLPTAQIYSSQMALDHLDNPVLLDSNINKAGAHQANLTFDQEVKRIYFSRCAGPNNCEIYTAVKNGDRFTNIQPLEDVNISGYNTTMPHFAMIGNQGVLFFSSDRPGGNGKMDIWYSEGTGTDFSTPKNAGDKVNSIDSEVTPFYLDNRLYFSSDWHEGFGGFDLFSSTGIPGKFESPKNLGRPINSRVNDLYYSYSKQWKTGFLVSNRPGSFYNKGETCCTDLYSFGYADSINIDTSEYASLEELNDYLPVTLYFHNDRPNPATLDTTTDLTYLETYTDYLSRSETYIEKMTAGFSGDEKEEKAYEVEEFFSLFVEKGMNDLNTFTDLLQKELESGKEVELAIRGFASPRAKTDYNEHLAKRRINSLVNYLKDFENGKLLPYFADTASSGGSLEIVQIPFGETKAASDVSDALQDEEESIYSVAASLERKIEITSVQPDTNKVEPTEINLGIVAPQKSVPFSHTLKNDFVRTMTIDSVIVSCDCISGSLPGDSIAAGDSLTFQFSFNSEEYRGEVLRQVLFYLNGNTEPRILKIRAFVRRED
jgi:tetratricopeptide (TPR) repeat protein